MMLSMIVLLEVFLTTLDIGCVLLVYDDDDDEEEEEEEDVNEEHYGMMWSWLLIFFLQKLFGVFQNRFQFQIVGHYSV